jgi:signal peptidase I
MRQAKGFWQEYKGLLFFIGCMLVFRSAVADWNYVPSSSMNPTLIAGDRVVVNKLAYSARVPFTLTHIARWSTPQVGDVITFDSPVDDVNLIKRVVAVAGDTVKMVDNTLYVNGVRQTRTLVMTEREIPTEQGLLRAEIWREQLGNLSHETARLPEFNRFTDLAPVQVPPDHVMVLGDSRDNSRDSRYIGFIDVRRVTGQAVKVLMSHDIQHLYWPRANRWWISLSAES